MLLLILMTYNLTMVPSMTLTGRHTFSSLIIGMLLR